MQKLLMTIFLATGYKVNTVEIPQLITRENWNYIKTIDINITGSIPQEHLEKIKNIFNTGVTLWHNDNVGNYNRTNSIIGGDI